MGRWRPKGKKAVPKWASTAPKYLVDDIVREFPKIFPPESSLPQIYDVLEQHLEERLPEGAPRTVTLDEFEAGFAYAALVCGMDPAYIHAFRVAGAWVTLEKISTYLDSGTVVHDWINAVQEHRDEFPPDP